MPRWMFTFTKGHTAWFGWLRVFGILDRRPLAPASREGRDRIFSNSSEWRRLMINRLPAKQPSKCRPLLFWCCWVLVNPGFSESGLSKIRFIQNVIFLRLLL